MAEQLRPEGLAGSVLPGPFPVGSYAGAAARGAAQARPRPALRRGLQRRRRAHARVLRAARRRRARCRARCGATPSTASGCREGALADGAQVVVAGGPDYYPGSRTSSPSFSFDVSGPARGGRGRPARPARRAAPRGSPPRACSSRRSASPRPALPRCIGVVTGESGKARDDVLAGLRRRGWVGPARVGVRAGAGPPRGAARSRARCRTSPPLDEVEVIVVARGGGSLADLFAFCDETLCRTVALLRVPVIASVGHHTDRTLIDDVAAVSCSTPTHAAEAAVPLHAARRAPRCARPPAAGPRTAAARSSSAPASSRGCRARPGEHVARQRRRPAPDAARAARERDAPAARPSAARGTPARRGPAPPRGRRRRARRRRAPSRARRRSPLALAAHDPERVVERGYAVVDDRDGQRRHERRGARARRRRAPALRRRRRRCHHRPRTSMSEHATEHPDLRGGHRPPGGRSSGAWTPARPACARRSTSCREGRGLVEFCAAELDAVGEGLEELRLDELVARLERRAARAVSDLRRARRPAADDRRLRARGPASATSPATSRARRRSSACAAPARRASARTSPTRPTTTTSCRTPGRSSRWRATWTLASFCDHVEALDLWPRAADAASLAPLPPSGPTSRPRSTSRCARPGCRCTRRSGASRAR